MQPADSLHQPAAACYSCKIIFHFQTWGIGFNLCPVLRLAKWKLAFVMQINAELQKADKRTHTHAENHIHRDSLSSPTRQHQRQQPVAPCSFLCAANRYLALISDLSAANAASSNTIFYGEFSADVVYNLPAPSKLCPKVTFLFPSLFSSSFSSVSSYNPLSPQLCISQLPPTPFVSHPILPSFSSSSPFLTDSYPLSSLPTASSHFSAASATCSQHLHCTRNTRHRACAASLVTILQPSRS